MATEIPTAAEFAALVQQKLRATLDPGGTGAVNLAAGSRNDTMISVTDALFSRVAQYAADRATARALTTATGDDLDALVADVYQDARKPASFATATFLLARTGTAATVIPAGSRLTAPATSTQPSVSLAVTQDVPVGSGVLTASVPVQCTQSDVVGNVYLPNVTQIQDPLPDATWTIAAVPANQPQFAAGGAPQESDDEFRARIQASAFDDSKRRGTKAALQTGALRVPGVANVTVVEPGDGTTLVFCGDTNYNISAALQTAVQVALEDWRAFGVPAIVRPYTVITVSVNLTIYMQRPLQNYNVTGLQASATAAVLAYFAGRQRPDEFFGSAITAAAGSVSAETQQVLINSISTSSGAQPDGTGSVRRVSDALYGSILSMARYVVSSTSVQVVIAPPATQ